MCLQQELIDLWEKIILGWTLLIFSMQTKDFAKQANSVLLCYVRTVGIQIIEYFLFDNTMNDNVPYGASNYIRTVSSVAVVASSNGTLCNISKCLCIWLPMNKIEQVHFLFWLMSTFCHESVLFTIISC